MIATKPFNYSGERAVPWNKATGKQVMIPHIMRYAWACQFVWDKDVVDIACGTGYGSYMMSWVARSVLGFDVSTEAVNYASKRFIADNLYYQTRNMLGGLPGANVYVAFECLEHIDNPRQVLEHVDNKTLVWSIPVNNNGRFHKRTYSVGEIRDLMHGSLFWYQGNGVVVPSGDWSLLGGGDPTYILGVLN